MPTVMDQVKDAAYTTVGVNLLVTDAVVGREVPAPEFLEEHATIARKHAKETLADFRARTEEPVAKLAERLPEPVGEAVTNTRSRAWKFIGIDAPKAKTATKAKAKTAGAAHHAAS